MIGRLSEISLPQPVDDCLAVLGHMLCTSRQHGAVMGSYWQPSNLLGGSSDASDKVSSLQRGMACKKCCLAILTTTVLKAWQGLNSLMTGVVKDLRCNFDSQIIIDSSCSQCPILIVYNSDKKLLQDLVTAILDIMGLSAGSVNDSDSLAGMGIDSMQLVEARFQCILCIV